MDEKTLEHLHRVLPEGAEFAAGELTDLFDLSEVVESIQRCIAALAERNGMPAHHFFLLEQLALSGGAAPLGELRHILNMPKQSATYIVDRLEKDGYVERRKDPADRRRYEIALTAEGRHLLKADLKDFYDVMLKALAHVSQADRQTILRGLRSFRDALSTQPREQGCEGEPGG